MIIPEKINLSITIGGSRQYLWWESLIMTSPDLPDRKLRAEESWQKLLINSETITPLEFIMSCRWSAFSTFFIFLWLKHSVHFRLQKHRNIWKKWHNRQLTSFTSVHYAWSFLWLLTNCNIQLCCEGTNGIPYILSQAVIQIWSLFGFCSDWFWQKKVKT